MDASIGSMPINMPKTAPPASPPSTPARPRRPKWRRGQRGIKAGGTRILRSRTHPPSKPNPCARPACVQREQAAELWRKPGVPRVAVLVVSRR